MDTKDYLYRYTDLPSLIHILTTRQITLLNPETWDDKNDSFLMTEYKERRRAKTLLALCFSQVRETYHHWRVFSHGSHGVCIRFNKQKFLNQFSIYRRIRHGNITYRERSAFESPATIDLEELPFLKRTFYSDEKEYRVIFVSERTFHRTKDYEISLDWIDRVTLSPWMPAAMLDSVKTALCKIDGCAELEVASSSVIHSEIWKTRIIEALKRSARLQSIPSPAIRRR